MKTGSQKEGMLSRVCPVESDSPRVFINQVFIQSTSLAGSTRSGSTQITPRGDI